MKAYGFQGLNAWAARTPLLSLGQLAPADHISTLAGTQDASVFDSAVDAVVELIYSSSAGGSPHPHQAALTPQLVHAVSCTAARLCCPAPAAARTQRPWACPRA